MIHLISKKDVKSPKLKEKLNIKFSRENAFRYSSVNEKKSTGATFTPPDLANYLSSHLVDEARNVFSGNLIQILDPALGDGVLVDTLVTLINKKSKIPIQVDAYETNKGTADRAYKYL